MELELTDEQRLERDVFRRWFTTELEPRVPEMERGERLPYELMRDMHVGLGLEARVDDRGRAAGVHAARIDDHQRRPRRVD